MTRTNLTLTIFECHTGVQKSDMNCVVNADVFVVAMSHGSD
jgi:hypothetical protein